MKQFTSQNQKTGEIGEGVSCKFLIKNGFKIIERNYTKKYGEIDIIATLRGKIHFFEVKTVSCEIDSKVIHETRSIRPEENAHPGKLRRLKNTMHAYLLEKNLLELDWQFDLLCIFLDLKRKKAKVERIENIVL